MNAQTNQPTNEPTFDKVLTSKHVHQSRIEGYMSKPKGKKGEEYNTSMRDARTNATYKFDVKVDFSGMLLKDALDKAAVDVKTDVMNNLRIKYPDTKGNKGDSETVRAAKRKRLEELHKAGELVVKATNGGRGLYQVTDEIAIQHLVAKDKDEALDAFKALREALIEQGVDPELLDATE